MKRTLAVLLACMIVLMGCMTQAQKTESKDASTIYEYSDKEITYSIKKNEVIDTYIIACALYLDFESESLLPNASEHEIYEKAVDHFKKYKDHELIGNFENYVNADDIKGDAIGILLSCSDDAYMKQLHEYPAEYRQGIFSDEEEILRFLALMRSFYRDSDAKSFFEDNAEIYEDMGAFINENIKDTKISQVIKVMEDYVGNGGKYYAGKEIQYESIMTLYRPSNASFFKVYGGDTVTLLALQSPNDYSRDPEVFDINQTVNTAVHEFLHAYINMPVAKQEVYIESLTKDQNKDKGDYAHRMYSNMKWNRIADENFVRAVQARIYKEVFGDDYAMKSIIEPQVKYGGFKHLESVYSRLSSYESDREKYPMIDDFIKEMIDMLFL